LFAEEVTAIAHAQQQLPCEISPSLYLSDARRAHDITLLQALHITHVLNVAGRAAQGPHKAYIAAGIAVLNIDADDEEGYPMLSRHLAECRAFIEEARQANGRCVVHCVAGINRSGVVVAAEKMLYEKLSVLDVVAHCRKQRGNTFLWNESFAASLVALARTEGLLGPELGMPGCRLPTPTADTSSPSQPRTSRPFRQKDIKGLF
jgi:predicted protein tyrosine phosphatase